MTSALEDIKEINISEWLTLATAPSPTKLKSGQTPFAYNTWVDEKPGSVITSNGFVKVGALPSGNPGTFCINYFKTSAGTQTFVVSDNSTVYTTIDFQNFTTIITGLSAAFQLRGAVIRDKLWLTNGNDNVRVFDGSTVTVLNGTNGNAVIQDITYTYNPVSGISPVLITVAYTTGAVAGAEVVSVTGNAVSVQIQSGISTATQVLAALNGSAAALALITPTITGVAGNAQTAPVSATPLSAGSPNVPKGRYIAYHDERVWIGHISSARSQCFFSALSDVQGNIIAPDNASAWPSQNFLQVSEGDADYLTGLLLYRGYLHFFKQYSIWRLVGYDEYTYTRVKSRASTGTRFSESLQILDSLVHMIGVDGIYVFDGEETERISDIIDPATAEQTAFGFNQLQQPNTNNQFWEVTATADFNAGTVPQNLAINNAATLQARDTVQADFQAAPTLTNIDTTIVPDSIQLSVTSSGKSNTNVAIGLGGAIVPLSNTGVIGVAAYMTDGNSLNRFGFSGSPSLSTGTFNLNSPVSTRNVTTIILRAVSCGNATMVLKTGGNPITPTAVSAGLTLSGSSINFPPGGQTDFTITIPAQTLTDLQLVLTAINNNTSFTLTEIEVYTAAYNATGQIVSRTLDLGDTPASLGNFFADIVLNGETLTFQTQSSADGVTWDAAVAVTNGSAIGSTPRRYLRWIGNFASDGLNTAVLSDAWVGTLYESAIHDTGGNIFTWGAFESDYSLNGQTIAFYYRGATTSLGVSAASWNVIVPGGAINMSTTFRFIQFKFEISGLSSGNNPPVVSSVTLNWVVGSASQPQVLQNVASFFWRNRYWLSAAGQNATSNNTILIRGKKTFASPWHLRDWNILAFTRYLDNFYGTDSTNANIYQLDTGYSKNGASLNSVFETGDFTFQGFQANIVEIVLETERLGPYTLTVSTSTNQGQSWVDHTVDLTPVVGGTTSFWKRINNLNLTTDKLRLRFMINATDQPWQVHNCIIYWKLSSQRGTIGVN